MDTVSSSYARMRRIAGILGRAVALRTVEIRSEGMVYGFELFRDGEI